MRIQPLWPYTGLMLALSVFWLAPARAATINGHGRFERIKGKPHMGYVELYETNLFISPTVSPPTGPSRRLGTTCQQGPTCVTTIITGDGCYCADLGPGGYSIFMNQPLFFVCPKVVPNIVLQNNQTLVINPELPIDYSTYFKDNNQWTGPEVRWFQTFIATGTSIRGVTFVLAGLEVAPGHAHSTAEVAILRDNGNPNPSLWDFVGARQERKIEVGSDNWVRFRSGEIPTIPGTRYALRISGKDQNYAGNVSIQPYKRNKDINSYTGGQAYNSVGISQTFDLNATVFSDNDGTIVTMNRRETGLGYLCDSFFAQQWGQTFIAKGGGLAGVDVWAAGASNRWDLDFSWKIKQGGPSGPQIGPTKITKGAFQAFGVGLHAVSYNPQQVPLVPGQTYYIEFTVHNPPPESNGFNPLVMRPSPGVSCGGGDFEDAYADGIAYRDGSPRPNDDLSMTIVEYALVGPQITLSTDAINRTVPYGTPAPSDSFTVRNTGSDTLNYTVSDNAAWLAVSPASGASAGAPVSHTVAYNVAGLPAGIYSATITVSADGVSNSPQTIPVTLTIQTVRPDQDGDGDVDQEDFGLFQRCYSGPGLSQTNPACLTARLDADDDVDQQDFVIFANCYSGAGQLADPACDD